MAGGADFRGGVVGMASSYPPTAALRPPNANSLQPTTDSGVHCSENGRRGGPGSGYSFQNRVAFPERIFSRSSAGTPLN